MVAVATLTCAGPAPMTEATAAMAEPPQMAVPDERSVLMALSVLSRRPSSQPRAKTPAIVAAAKARPAMPAWATLPRSMRRPRRTTQCLDDQGRGPACDGAALHHTQQREDDTQGEAEFDLISRHGGADQRPRELARIFRMRG